MTNDEILESLRQERRIIKILCKICDNMDYKEGDFVKVNGVLAIRWIKKGLARYATLGEMIEYEHHIPS